MLEALAILVAITASGPGVSGPEVSAAQGEGADEVLVGRFFQSQFEQEADRQAQDFSALLLDFKPVYVGTCPGELEDCLRRLSPDDFHLVRAARWMRVRASGDMVIVAYQSPEYADVFVVALEARKKGPGGRFELTEWDRHHDPVEPELFRALSGEDPDPELPSVAQARASPGLVASLSATWLALGPAIDGGGPPIKVRIDRPALWGTDATLVLEAEDGANWPVRWVEQAAPGRYVFHLEQRTAQAILEYPAPGSAGPEAPGRWSLPEGRSLRVVPSSRASQIGGHRRLPRAPIRPAGRAAHPTWPSEAGGHDQPPGPALRPVPPSGQAPQLVSP